VPHSLLGSLALVSFGVAACNVSSEPVGQTKGADTSTPGPAAGLPGNYGFLTDYSCQSEQAARGKIDEMVQTFGISDVQFYDWFASYGTPTAGDSWTDAWFHTRPICLQTILWYIDELHQNHARAWAYVQSIASEDATLASADAGIYPLLDAQGQRFYMGTHPTYFANAGWAQHQVGVWGQAVAGLGFDGIHWDTLGPIAGDYAAETGGFHDFLATAGPALTGLGLLQTMNFVNVSWWDDSLLALVAFPYAEVWGMPIEQTLYQTMSDDALQARWGVMAFYPSVDAPAGWTQSQTMLARWAEAPQHHLRYLVIGDGSDRLVDEYFPDAVALTSAETAALQQ
jgi:hypothetical protein